MSGLKFHLLSKMSAVSSSVGCEAPPSGAIDVHTFDGMLAHVFRPTFNLSDRQKAELFNMFHAKLTNAVAVNAVIIITRDLGTGANFQEENKTDCSDVLVEIIKHRNCPDLLLFIQEQLSDMVTSGLCPSGRVTRLLQIWTALEKGHASSEERKEE